MPKPVSGTGKGGLVLTREEQWEKHNKNSPLNEDLTDAERDERKINILRDNGVHEEELTPVHVIPIEKQRQGIEIDPLVNQSSTLITSWTRQRRAYYHLLFFGRGSAQAEGDMAAINDYCENELKPQLASLQKLIILAGGKPVYPPRCFAVPLSNLKAPVPPPKGLPPKGKPPKGKRK